jgi:hypothetical protein
MESESLKILSNASFSADFQKLTIIKLLFHAPKQILFMKKNHGAANFARKHAWLTRNIFYTALPILLTIFTKWNNL